MKKCLFRNKDDCILEGEFDHQKCDICVKLDIRDILEQIEENIGVVK